MSNYLTKMEAARELSVSTRTIDRMVRNGLPVCSLTGARTYRILRESLDEFLRKNQVTAFVPEVPNV